MKKYKVVVQHLSTDDIRQARKWYNEQQKGLGKRLTAYMKKTLLDIARNPTSFAIRYRHLRLANFEIFPYAAHFFIDEPSNTVFIAAFLHSKRHPDTAKKRL